MVKIYLPLYGDFVPKEFFFSQFNKLLTLMFKLRAASFIELCTVVVLFVKSGQTVYNLSIVYSWS